MFKLETAQLIQELISYLIVYFPTVTLAGYVEAWLAKKFGDRTPEHAGFLTLNPLVHMDPIGIAFVALPPHFGFGKRMPMDLDNIKKKNKTLKLLLLFMSRAITHLVLIILVLLFFGLTGKKALLYLMEGNIHPAIYSVLLIFHALLNLNILSAVIYFIIGLVRSCLHFLLPDIENQTGFMQTIIFLFPFLMILVLGPYVETILRIFLINFFGIL
jgi:hypothetical protein